MDFRLKIQSFVCIILDLLLAREPFFTAAANLFLLFQENRIKGFTSPVVFANLFYMLRQGMSAGEAVATLRKLRLLLGVLPADERVIDLALASSFVGFEDAIQYYTAAARDVDGRRDPQQEGLQIRRDPGAECSGMCGVG